MSLFPLIIASYKNAMHVLKQTKMQKYFVKFLQEYPLKTFHNIVSLQPKSAKIQVFFDVHPKGRHT